MKSQYSRIAQEEKASLTNIEVLAVPTVLIIVNSEFVVEIAIVCHSLRDTDLWDRATVSAIDRRLVARSVKRTSTDSRACVSRPEGNSPDSTLASGDVLGSVWQRNGRDDGGKCSSQRKTVD